MSCLKEIVETIAGLGDKYDKLVNEVANHSLSIKKNSEDINHIKNNTDNILKMLSEFKALSEKNNSIGSVSMDIDSRYVLKSDLDELRNNDDLRRYILKDYLSLNDKEMKVMRPRIENIVFNSGSKELEAIFFKKK